MQSIFGRIHGTLPHLDPNQLVHRVGLPFLDNYYCSYYIILYTERPDPPFNVTASDYGARWVSLQWRPNFDGNRPVTSFLVFIHFRGDSFSFSLTNPADGLVISNGNVMYNISDSDRILPYTNYSFTVVSCNEIGCSDQSDPSPTVETDQDGKVKSAN